MEVSENTPAYLDAELDRLNVIDSILNATSNAEIRN